MINWVCTGIEISSASGSRTTRPSGIAPSIERQKIGHLRRCSARFACTSCKLLARFLTRITSPGLDQVAGNVDTPAVDRDVPVADQLPGLGAAEAEAQPMHDVVQPALEQAHQRVAGVALGAAGAAEVAAELPLQHAVVMLDLLLLAQVQAVVGLLAAAILVHARRACRGARSRTSAYRSACP